MNQKRVKKLRKMLRDEKSANVPLAVVNNPKPLPDRLLMRRKDPHPDGLSPNLYRGGAINHPLSDRALYQFAKKKDV